MLRLRVINYICLGRAPSLARRRRPSPTRPRAKKTTTQVLQRTGSPAERRRAIKLLPVVKRPHWMLCTLVLINASCMEALPIFLDRLLDPVAAVLISVSAILLFGEIAPQAICARCVWGVCVVWGTSGARCGGRG